MYIKALLVLFILFDLLGVAMGYEGIERLRKFHYPPFLEGMYHVWGWFWFPPNWLILSWASVGGRITMWFGCLFIPLMCGILSITKGRHLLALMIILFWTLASGVTGLWIWLDAVFNAVEM